MAPQDWHGPAAERPGLMKRRWQLEEPAAEPTEEERNHLGRILFNVPVTDLAELEALCSPAKGALGITKATPRGRLGDGWRWVARHGAGVRLADGKVTESLALKLQHDDSRRAALFLWTRPVWPLDVVFGMARWWTYSPLIMAAHWPVLAAMVRALPKPKWESALTSAWTIGENGRPDDLPRPVPSADVKKEVQT